MKKTRRRDFASFYPYHSRREMNAAKREADRIFALALASGLIRRQPCARCGHKRVQGHHEDYSKPLSVIWLCRPHHAIRHAEIREAARNQQPPVLESPPPEPVVTRVFRRNGKRLNLHAIAQPVVHQATVAVAEAMDVAGVNEYQLAQRLGCSRQSMNDQFSRGVRTLATLATLADAIGFDVHVQLVKRERQVAA